MEDVRLQALHDSLSASIDKRGKKGGLGRVKGTPASIAVFRKESNTCLGSELYSRFVKGPTLGGEKSTRKNEEEEEAEDGVCMMDREKTKRHEEEEAYDEEKKQIVKKNKKKRREEDNEKEEEEVEEEEIIKDKKKRKKHHKEEKEEEEDTDFEEKKGKKRRKKPETEEEAEVEKSDDEVRNSKKSKTAKDSKRKKKESEDGQNSSGPNSSPSQSASVDSGLKVVSQPPLHVLEVTLPPRGGFLVDAVKEVVRESDSDASGVVIVAARGHIGKVRPLAASPEIQEAETRAVKRLEVEDAQGRIDFSKKANAADAPWLLFKTPTGVHAAQSSTVRTSKKGPLKLVVAVESSDVCMIK